MAILHINVTQGHGALGNTAANRMILEMYDGMAAAMQGGAPYATRLDPPPADARVAYEG